MSKGWRVGVLVILAIAVLVAIGLNANRTREARRAAGESTVAERDARSDADSEAGSDASAGKADRLPRLVDLGSKECIPCRMMEPVLDELTKEYKGRLEVVVIDLQQNPRAQQAYGVRMIPTQVFYDREGRQFYRHIGFFSKEDILSTFAEHGIKL